jgi:hypothetical protein
MVDRSVAGAIRIYFKYDPGVVAAPEISRPKQSAIGCLNQPGVGLLTVAAATKRMKHGLCELANRRIDSAKPQACQEKPEEHH